MNKAEYVSRKIMDRYNDRWIRKYQRLYERIHDLEAAQARIIEYLASRGHPLEELQAL